jgi:hypothetical protein
MPDSTTPAGDALEQQQDPVDADSAVTDDVPQVALEASEADAVEQQTSLRDDDPATTRSDAPWDADEGDLAEGAREVGYDDDNYR